MAILSLVLGIIGLIFSFFIIGIIPAILGLIFGILTLKKKRDGSAIAGVVCSVIAIVISVTALIVGVFVSTLQDRANSAEEAVVETEHVDMTAPGSEAESPKISYQNVFYKDLVDNPQRYHRSYVSFTAPIESYLYHAISLDDDGAYSFEIETDTSSLAHGDYVTVKGRLSKAYDSSTVKIEEAVIEYIGDKPEGFDEAAAEYEERQGKAAGDDLAETLSDIDWD